MSEVVFKERQNVATLVTDVEGGFTVQVHTRDNGSSETYTHTYSNTFTEVEQDLLQRGVKAVLAGSYNGVTDQQVVLEQVNKVFANLQEGKVTCRVVSATAGSVAKDKPLEKLSYLLQAVLRSYPELTQKMWAGFSKEERKGYVTKEVLKLARKIEVFAVADKLRREEQAAGQEAQE